MFNQDIQAHNRPKFGMERTSSIGSGFYHKQADRADIFGSELSSVELRKELKRNEQAHRELLDHIKKLGQYYNN